MIQDGTLVRVYRNLNKPGFFSVQAKTADGWRVVDYVRSIALVDATFYVSEAGRQRTLAKKRCVHAWVEGKVSSTVRQTSTYIRYNPFICGSFTVDGQAIKAAPAVFLLDCRTYIGAN